MRGESFEFKGTDTLNTLENGAYRYLKLKIFCPIFIKVQVSGVEKWEFQIYYTV